MRLPCFGWGGEAEPPKGALGMFRAVTRTPKSKKWCYPKTSVIEWLNNGKGKKSSQPCGSHRPGMTTRIGTWTTSPTSCEGLANAASGFQTPQKSL